jgi:acetoin utilization protein AcuB
MSKAIPTVQRYMTTVPYSIGPDQNLSLAHAMMRDHHVRHLPVLLGGKLVGILTDRDLHLIETLKDVDPDEVTVEDAMSQMPYSVHPDSPLDEVADEMAEHKYGCAVVIQNSRVVGVLTTVDICRALAELLRGRLVK